MATGRSRDPHQRSPRQGVTLTLLVLVLVGALVTFWGWRGGSVVSQPATDVTNAGPPSAAPETSPEVAEATQPAPKGPVPEPAPRSTAPDPALVTGAPTPTTADAPAMVDAQEGPVHITIARGAEVLVDAPVALTQLNARDELNPPPGVVGWYGPPEWATVPGDLSTYPGVLAGHTSYDGAHDVFHRLGEVRADDVITIGYADGGQARFTVDEDALSVPKNDVTEKADADYAWVWSLPAPDRKVSLFSCDASEGLDITGHSINNWVVQATRTV